MRSKDKQQLHRNPPDQVGYKGSETLCFAGGGRCRVDWPVALPPASPEGLWATCRHRSYRTKALRTTYVPVLAVLVSRDHADDRSDAVGASGWEAVSRHTLQESWAKTANGVDAQAAATRALLPGP